MQWVEFLYSLAQRPIKVVRDVLRNYCMGPNLNMHLNKGTIVKL